MDWNSNLTLDKVAVNDSSYNELWIGFDQMFGSFISSRSNDFARLGSAIGDNTHVTTVKIELYDRLALDVNNQEFFNGLKRNTSINKLSLWGDHNITEGVYNKILKVFQEKGDLTSFGIVGNNNLDYESHHLVNTLLRDFTILKQVTLQGCGITDDTLLPIVEVLTGRASLEEFHLPYNSIGNSSCEELVRLLEDPKCNLQYIHINHNNSIDQNVESMFLNALCNPSTIQDTYSSNHTLQKLVLPHHIGGNLLAALLKLNKDTNRSRVTIQKILLNHLNIDMEPLFKWAIGEEGEVEYSLKSLPYVIDWLRKAEETVGIPEQEDFPGRRLSAIYQFTLAMPLMFRGIAKFEENVHKRKWAEI